jgi:uncharacterized repeat protein (TIGR04076 family)
MPSEAKYGLKVTAVVVEAKGHCDAGHKVGDRFDLNIIDTCGLCGAFYHSLFPSLQTFQFGGNIPWFSGDKMFAQCPDPKNTVTLMLERSKWE